MSKLTPTQTEVRASLRGRLEDVIEDIEAVRAVMRDELPRTAVVMDGRLDDAAMNVSLIAERLR